MKKLLKPAFSVTVAALISVISIFTCFAKGVLMLDNEVSVGYNDTVTYTLYLGDCEKPVTDMVAYLFYDSDYLELDRDSVNFHDLVGVNRNTELDGYIPFNFSTMSAPVDFSDRTPVVSLDFKVLKEGNSDIKYFIGELDCGDAEKSGVVRNYTFTCDYNAHWTDGDEITENVTPVLLDNADRLNELQGGFVNYADGKGEQESPGEEHIAVTGDMSDGITDVVKGSGNNTMIILAVIVTALAAAVIIVLRKRFASDSEKDI